MQIIEKIRSSTITREDARNISAAFGQVAEKIAPRTAQEVFLDLKKKRKELKELREQLAEHYRTDSRYAQNEEFIRQTKEKQRIITDELKAGVPSLIDKLEALRDDIKSDKEIFADMMIVKTLKGESTELKDEYEQPCFPFFSVSMKPAGS